jgi:hypothetical protein
MTDYESAMSSARRRYADVVAAVGGMSVGRAFVTQTGGMCLAVEVALPDGRYLLITDECGSLPWDRGDLTGWGVGVYLYDDSGMVGNDCLSFAGSDGLTSLHALRETVERVLVQAAA